MTGFLTALVAGSAGLVMAGSSDPRTTAFSIDVPASSPVARVAPGHSVCQGPILVPAAFDGITTWTAAVPASGLGLAVTVRQAETGTPLARANLVAQSAAALGGVRAIGGSLSRTISSGQRVSVCFRSTGARVTDLLGSAAGVRSGRLTLGRRPVKLALALVFRMPHPASVLSLIPTIFTRAALFHPSWVGGWTFWVLLIGIAASAIPLLASLLSAASADERADRLRGPA